MKTSVTPVEPQPNLTLRAHRHAKRVEAVKNLRKCYLKQGDAVYVVLRHTGKTGKSGTTRYYDMYALHGRTPQRLTWDASIALCARYDRARAAIRVDQSDSDTSRHLVSSLAWKLFDDSRALEYYCMGY